MELISASHLPENVAAAGWGEPADGAAAAAAVGAIRRLAGCCRTDAVAAAAGVVHNAAGAAVASRLPHIPG